MRENRFVNLRDKFVDQEHKKRNLWLNSLLNPLVTRFYQLSRRQVIHEGNIVGQVISKSALFGTLQVKITEKERNSSNLSEIDQEKVIEQFEQVLRENDIFFFKEESNSDSSYQLQWDLRQKATNFDDNFSKNETDFLKNSYDILDASIQELIHAYITQKNLLLQSLKNDLTEELFKQISGKEVIRTAEKHVKLTTLERARFSRTGYRVGPMSHELPEAKLRGIDDFSVNGQKIVFGEFRPTEIQVNTTQMFILIGPLRVPLEYSGTDTNFHSYNISENKLLLRGDKFYIYDISEKITQFEEGKTGIFDFSKPIAPVAKFDSPIGRNIIKSFVHHPTLNEFFLHSQTTNAPLVRNRKSHYRYGLHNSSAVLINYKGKSKVINDIFDESHHPHHEPGDIEIIFNPEKREFVAQSFYYQEGKRGGAKNYIKCGTFSYAMSSLNPKKSKQYSRLGFGPRLTYLDSERVCSIDINHHFYVSDKEMNQRYSFALSSAVQENRPYYGNEEIHFSHSSDKKLFSIRRGVHNCLAGLSDDFSYISGVGNSAKLEFVQGSVELEPIVEEVFEEIREAGINIFFTNDHTVYMQWDWTDLT